MKTEFESGGRAFPNVPGDSGIYHFNEQGMTLRQYYVAKILQGEIAKHGVHNTAEEEVELAFKLADMMIQYEDEE